MQGDDVVRLAEAGNTAEAYVWKQALAGEGIESRVVGGDLETGFGNISPVRPEVWVHRADYERARAFLEAHRGGAAGSPEAEDEA
jgi:hypothetical protein